MPFAPERQRLEFLPGVASRLGWYVYALRDPRDRSVFYIGNGKGNRAYERARAAGAGGGSLLDNKRGLIKQIHHAGLEVIVEIVRFKLADEKVAYEVEAAVIDPDRPRHGSSRTFDGRLQLLEYVPSLVSGPPRPQS